MCCLVCKGESLVRTCPEPSSFLTCALPPPSPSLLRPPSLLSASVSFACVAGLERSCLVPSLCPVLILLSRSCATRIPTALPGSSSVTSPADEAPSSPSRTPSSSTDGRAQACSPPSTRWITPDGRARSGPRPSGSRTGGRNRELYRDLAVLASASSIARARRTCRPADGSTETSR